MSPIERVSETADRLWRRGDVLRAALGAGPVFPYRVPLTAPRGAMLLADFQSKRDAIERLQTASASGGHFAIEYRDVVTRTAGTQRVPAAVVFATAQGVAAQVGKADVLRAYVALAARVEREFPSLRAWLLERPFDVLDCVADWPRIAAVLRHFRARPRPGLYLRELDIHGVDTKFVERRRALLRDLLDLVLPAEAVDATVAALGDGGFERRYGLAYDSASFRVRLLDPALAPWPGISDFALPPGQFAHLALPLARVFVVENKLNALTFPPVARALVVFGQGYRACALGEIAWLHRCALHYWGDLDTHGFSILDRLRASLPHTRSLLMDETTLLDHRELWTAESSSRRVVAELDRLDDTESAAYRALRDNRYGTAVRLEQERIGQAYAEAAVRSRCD